MEARTIRTFRFLNEYDNRTRYYIQIRNANSMWKSFYLLSCSTLFYFSNCRFVSLVLARNIDVFISLFGLTGRFVVPIHTKAYWVEDDKRCWWRQRQLHDDGDAEKGAEWGREGNANGDENDEYDGLKKCKEVCSQEELWWCEEDVLFRAEIALYSS